VDDEVLTDELWARLEPLIPVRARRFKHPGRLRTSDRAAFEGILWVARTGIGWNRLPTALFGASGATCWRRLAEWQDAGVWQKLHEVLLGELRGREAGPVRGDRGLLPPARTQRGDQVGPSPVDRGRNGSKHHLITDAAGIPLAVTLTGGNRNDVTQLLPLLEAIPKIRGTRGRPAQRPDRVYADRGYDHDSHRVKVRALGITPVIARRGTRNGSGLGIYRWYVERSFAWLHGFKRLRTRYERRADIHQALISVVCSAICLRQLNLN